MNFKIFLISVTRKKSANSLTYCSYIEIGPAVSFEEDQVYLDTI